MNEQNSTKTNINWYPGHMVKAKKEIIENLKLIDVVLELVDARIPLSSRNPDIDDIIGNKPRIIILNKSDLSDENKNKKWTAYFNKVGYEAVCTDSTSGKGLDETVKVIFKLMKEKLEEESKKGRVGRSVRVAILGIPNVGKSSFINKIAKRSATIVGNKPGVTKTKKWIRLQNKIELLDTPGVLWPKFANEEEALNLAFVGTIRDEILDIEEIAVKLLERLQENYLSNIKQRYKINETEEYGNEYQLLELIGKKRGCILSGGVINTNKAANIVIDEYRAGKLGKITLERFE